MKVEKVEIYVEAPSDKLAMEALLRPLIEVKLQQGTKIEFIPTKGKNNDRGGDAKKDLLTKIPIKAVNIIKEYLQITDDELESYSYGLDITEDNLNNYLPSKINKVIKTPNDFRDLLNAKGESFARLQLQILLQLDKANRLSKSIFKLNQFSNLVKGISTDTDTIDEANL
ncbi:MAG: hypothetical protein RLZZ184_3729, partial [Cyanobacteriota bacterium]